MTMAAFATTSPTVGQQFSKLIDMAVVYSLISYLYSSIALIRLRKAGEPGAMRDWIMAGLAGVFSVWVIVESDPLLLLIAMALAVTSIPLYPFFKGRPYTAPVVVRQEAEA